MHYLTKYSGNDTAEDRAKAVQDINDYLGDEQFHRVVAGLKTHDKPDLEYFHGVASFAGIEGYPVIALYHFIWE